MKQCLITVLLLRACLPARALAQQSKREGSKHTIGTDELWTGGDAAGGA